MTDVSHDVTNRSLLAWVDEMAALCQPDQVHWCDGSQEEYDALCDQMVDARHVHPAEPGQAARTASSPAPIPSDVARVEDRTFICSRQQGRRRPDQQLDGRRDEMKATLDGAVRRLHARPHDVRGPVQHGPARLADRAHRRRAHRLAVRRRQHADHDPHGHARCSTCSAATATSCRCLHSVGAPLAPGAGRRALAVQPRAQVHRPLPRGARDLVATARGYGGNALLGKKCLALRIASVHGPRRGLARRAHADPRRRSRPRARRPTSPRRSRAPAARPTSRC